LWSLPGDLNRKSEHARIAAKLFSDSLTNDHQKQRRVNVCLEIQEKAKENPTFMSRIVTDDKIWIYGYDPETKQHSLQWKSPQLPRAKKAWQVRVQQRACSLFFFLCEEGCSS
jgi:hypothetical protein